VLRVIERMLASERSTYLSIVCFCFLMICPLPLSPPLAWYLECSSASSLSRSAAFPAILSVEPAQPGIHGPLLCAFCLSAKSVTSPPCTLCALTPDPETNLSRLKQPSEGCFLKTDNVQRFFWARSVWSKIAIGQGDGLLRGGRATEPVWDICQGGCGRRRHMPDRPPCWTHGERPEPAPWRVEIVGHS
jgi:hypothetical protein